MKPASRQAGSRPTSTGAKSSVPTFKPINFVLKKQIAEAAVRNSGTRVLTKGSGVVSMASSPP